MVDELQVWPHAKHRCFKGGSAHLTTDGPLAELHSFAASIGLKREWFQAHSSAPHYDLSPKRHAAALEAGAVLVSAREQAKRRIAARAALQAAEDEADCVGTQRARMRAGASELPGEERKGDGR